MGTIEAPVQTSGLRRWESCQHHLTVDPYHFEHFVPKPQPEGSRADYSCSNPTLVEVIRSNADVLSATGSELSFAVSHKPMYGFTRKGATISTTTIRLHTAGFDSDPSVQQSLNDTCARCPFYEKIVS